MAFFAFLETIWRYIQRRFRGPVFEVFCGPSKLWFVRELAGNGETLNVSEAYASKANAVRAAKRQAGRTRHASWRVAV